MKTTREWFWNWEAVLSHVSVMDKKGVLTGPKAFCSIVSYVRWSFYFPSVGTSLVAQGLRFHTPPAGSMRWPLLRKLRFPKTCTVWPAEAGGNIYIYIYIYIYTISFPNVNQSIQLSFLSLSAGLMLCYNTSIQHRWFSYTYTYIHSISDCSHI